MRAGLLLKQMQTLLGDPNGDYHNDAKMLLHINTALTDICTRARTLCTWHYEAGIEGQGMYGLPEAYLETKYAGYYDNGEMYELRPGGVPDVAPAIFREPRSKQIPHTYAHAGNAYIEKVLAVVIEHPLGGDNTGETSFFSDVPAFGVKIGDRIINMTDNSEGEVLELSQGFSEITFKNLINGDRNTMAVGDVFRILSTSEHRHAIAISPPPPRTDPFGAESIYLYIARDHKPITEEDLERENDEIELGTEWDSAIRHRVGYYASLEENGIDHQKTIAFSVQYETDYRKTFPSANRRIRQYLTSWRQQGQRIKPRRTIVQKADYSVRIPN